MQFIDLKTQQKQIRTKIDNRINTILDHGKYIMGPEVFELEEKLAEYVRIKHCISCSSGTDALLIPLLAMGIGRGDAVITTPFTYIATVEVISLLGATPVFCDINKKTFNINPSGLQKAYDLSIAKGLSPKVIMPVDLFGLPANYSLINDFAEQNNLVVLEDAAQSFGGMINENRCGFFGDVSATSFFPAKPLGCYGDGGAIFTDNDDLANKIKSIRIHGSGKDKYDNVRIGLNGRLDTIQAAIILEKLRIFDNELILRKEIAETYTENLSNKFICPYVPSNYQSSWAQYSILLTENLDRNVIMESLNSQGIPTMVYYKIPIHLQKAYKKYGYMNGDFPISEYCSENILSLPMHPYLKNSDQNKIIETLNLLC